MEFTIISKIFNLDGLTMLYFMAFCIIALLTNLFAVNKISIFEHLMKLGYIVSTCGVILAHDFALLLIFWEFTTIFAAILTFKSASEYSVGLRYTVMHLLSGASLVAGIAGHITLYNSNAFTHIDYTTFSGALIFSGILINCGVVPVNAWVTDTYPRVSVYNTITLSSFTTKAALLVLIKLFANTEILTYIGVITAFYALVQTSLTNDLRRLLAHNSIGQMGIIVAGISVSNTSALGIQAIASLFYQVLLYMIVGVIVLHTKKNRLTDFYNCRIKNNFLLFNTVIAVLSLGACPLTLPFITKGIFFSTIDSVYLRTSLTLASAGLFITTGLRLLYFLFLRRTQNTMTVMYTKTQTMAIILCTSLCILPAMFYNTLFPLTQNHVVLTIDHIVTQLQILVISTIVFYFFRALLKPRIRNDIDIDYLYRVLLLNFWHLGIRMSSKFFSSIKTYSIDTIHNITQNKEMRFLQSTDHVILITLLILSLSLLLEIVDTMFV